MIEVYSDRAFILGVCAEQGQTEEQINAWAAEHRPRFTVNRAVAFYPNRDDFKQNEQGDRIAVPDYSPIPCPDQPGREHWILMRVTGPSGPRLGGRQT